MHIQICSRNNAKSVPYFSSSSRNKATSGCYFPSSSLNSQSLCFISKSSAAVMTHGFWPYLSLLKKLSVDRIVWFRCLLSKMRDSDKRSNSLFTNNLHILWTIVPQQMHNENIFSVLSLRLDESQKALTWIGCYHHSVRTGGVVVPDSTSPGFV